MPNFYLNKAAVGGRMTRNPVLRLTDSRTYITTFNISVDSEKGRGAGRPALLRVAAFGYMAEFIARHFRKGIFLCVIGSLSSRFWIDHRGNRQQVTEIYAEEVFPLETLSAAVQLPLEDEKLNGKEILF
jgi:single-stranded DNA-binding protein